MSDRAPNGIDTSRISVGERIRLLRTRQGLSQRQLASPGVTYAYISRIEAGARDPSVKALRKIAEKLAVSPYYLEHGREDPALVLAAIVLDAPASDEEARLARQIIKAHS